MSGWGSPVYLIGLSMALVVLIIVLNRLFSK